MHIFTNIHPSTTWFVLSHKNSNLMQDQKKPLRCNKLQMGLYSALIQALCQDKNSALHVLDRIYQKVEII